MGANQQVLFGLSASAVTPVPTSIGTNTGSAGATVAVTVPGGGVPAGVLIGVLVTEFNVTAGGTLADTAGNTYSTAQNGISVNGNGRGYFFFVLNATALNSGNTITYTKATSGNTASITAFYSTGIATSSALDGTVTATATGNSASPTVTSGSAAQSGELFVGALWYTQTGGAFTQDTGHGWAIPPNAATTTNCQAAGGSQVNAGTGTKIFNPTVAAGSDYAIGTYGFKHA